MSPHAGVIIAATVLVAAGIAAYENPQVREWFEKSSQKVAMAFRSLGDDIQTRSRPRRQDSSMHEDHDEKAEERRRRARQEVEEKGRVLQEQRKRRKLSKDNSRTPSFDLMVDEEGRLRADASTSETDGAAVSSGVEVQEVGDVRSRHEQPQMHQSVDSPMLLRQFASDSRRSPTVEATEPWESQYEREMRTAWNIELPSRSHIVPPSHASESLIDLTPDSEEFPDPDYSIPSTEDLRAHLGRTEYFSAAASQVSHDQNPFDDGWDQAPLTPLTPMEPRPMSPHDMHSNVPSAFASLASSTSAINRSDAEMTDDDLSEFGDGIRTPASAWTEVASSVSGDD